mgnify:CR=1 FL=1
MRVVPFGTLPDKGKVEYYASLGIDEVVGLARSILSGPDLSPRERQVAAQLAAGATNRQAGRTLGINERTVETHVAHIMAKLDARSRAEIAAWATRHGLGTGP